MVPHGPAAKVFEAASNAELKPERIAENTMVQITKFLYRSYLCDFLVKPFNILENEVFRNEVFLCNVLWIFDFFRSKNPGLFLFIVDVTLIRIIKIETLSAK